MQKKHEQLAALLKQAETVAKELEAEGCNVQGAIHSIRNASTLVGLRIKAYEAEPKPKKAKGDA
jgi:uncharacterized protein YfcZ (UPF0381/DUF406 family)